LGARTLPPMVSPLPQGETGVNQTKSKRAWMVFKSHTSLCCAKKKVFLLWESLDIWAHRGFFKKLKIKSKLCEKKKGRFYPIKRDRRGKPQQTLGFEPKNYRRKLSGMSRKKTPPMRGKGERFWPRNSRTGAGGEAHMEREHPIESRKRAGLSRKAGGRNFEKKTKPPDTDSV